MLERQLFFSTLLELLLALYQILYELVEQLVTLFCRGKLDSRAVPLKH